MNPNVFYELGVRHTLRNRTILVSQTMDDVPSDLRQYGVIIYETSPKGVTEYKKKINTILKDIRNNPDRSDNPVSDYLHLKSIVTDPFEAKSIEKKLLALVSECSYNLTVIDSAIEISKPEVKSITTVRFRIVALELLTSTYYIYPSDNYIKEANNFLSNFSIQNAKLDLQREHSFRETVKKGFVEQYPSLQKRLEKFMSKTYKILKDFRNQNFIEPSELVLCVSEEKHKEYLD